MADDWIFTAQAHAKRQDFIGVRQIGTHAAFEFPIFGIYMIKEGCEEKLLEKADFPTTATERAKKLAKFRRVKSQRAINRAERRKEMLEKARLEELQREEAERQARLEQEAIERQEKIDANATWGLF
ncbi:MAG: hypothetical protein JJ979_02545 [Roseibium sp.]|nr:hypothetical protein [Roseibium sp.]